MWTIFPCFSFCLWSANLRLYFCANRVEKYIWYSSEVNTEYGNLVNKVERDNVDRETTNFRLLVVFLHFALNTSRFRGNFREIYKKMKQQKDKRYKLPFRHHFRTTRCYEFQYFSSDPLQKLLLHKKKEPVHVPSTCHAKARHGLICYTMQVHATPLIYFCRRRLNMILTFKTDKTLFQNRIQ